MLSHIVLAVCRAQHLLRRAHPIGRNVKFSSSAHGADSHFAKKHMLAQAMRQGRWVIMGLRPIPHYLAWVYAFPFSYPNGVNAESVSSAHGAEGQLASQHMLFHIIIPVGGYGGFAPMFTHRP